MTNSKFRMTEEKELQERINRTVDIFHEQIKRALGDDCGIFIALGNDKVNITAFLGSERNINLSMSMLICQDKNTRNFIKDALSAAEHVMKACNTNTDSYENN